MTRPGDGPGPALSPWCTLVPLGLPLHEAVETAMLLEALRLAEQGDAFWHAAALVPAQWRREAVQVGTN